MEEYIDTVHYSLQILKYSYILMYFNEYSFDGQIKKLIETLEKYVIEYSKDD